MNAETRALLELAVANERRGELAAARALYEDALRAAPGDPRLLLALGELGLRGGDLRGAAERFEAAVASRPSEPALRARLAADYAALAHALRSRGKHDASVLAFDQAAQLAPDDAAAWTALGNACMETEMLRVAAQRRASARSGGALPHDMLAAALAAFSRAASLAPASANGQASLALAARYACAFAEARTAEGALDRLAGATAFACEPMSAVALLEGGAAQRRGIAGFVAAHLPAPAAPGLVTRRGSRLRVGYLSSDFHDHATAHLAAGLFERHDRARYEVFAYATDRDDGSTMRARLRKAFEHWRDLRERSDEAAAQDIRNDALDVLVDLKGHTRGARLAILAPRPAPVQLHYLGFPGTIAYGAIDGLVADAVVAPPGSEDEFAEPLLRLPLCYQVNDDRRMLPPACSRSEAGLPERGIVLACFNQTFKLAEPCVAAWLRVLRDEPDAVLWLTVPHALAQRNLVRQAQAVGVTPSRIVFAPMLPQAAHLARLRCADLALDVLPYGSHTTGSDALFAGVPLLTCRGGSFAGRVGASLCAAVALPELVTESLHDYEMLLRALCRERGRLAHYRNHLEAGRNRLPLFATEGFTRAFEHLLEGAASAPARRT